MARAPHRSIASSFALVAFLGIGMGCAASEAGRARSHRAFVLLSAGEHHVCAARRNGELACAADWSGSEAEGPPGRGARSNLPTPHDLGTLVALASGRDRTCALDASGSVRCFGFDASTVVASPEGVDDARAIGMSALHLAIARPRSVVEVYDTRDGQLAHATRRTADGHMDLPAPAATTSVGSRFACATTTSEHAYCWGTNWGGECGNGGDGLETDPVAVASPLPADSAEVEKAYEGCDPDCGHVLDGTFGVVARDRTACALRASSGLVCWGTSVEGAFLAESHPTDFVRRPVAVAGTAGATDACLGLGHVCVLLPRGVVACRGSIGASDAMTPVDSLDGASAIDCTRQSVCAVLPSGRVRCVGADERTTAELR